jgi:leucyl-tRNA synthetase
MQQGYDHVALEAKWQKIWDDTHAFRTPETFEGEKAYVLDMFPYPSGAGLHVGHMAAYAGSDVIARVARKRGKAVLHPMGWDAFGLPAENYAIKSGVHPAISTAANIEHFKRQFAQIGISYDWSREINTSLPEYYRWTQWLFGVLYKRGLAYRKDGSVNWCPRDQTVLANEQVVGGVCERCGTPVVQRKMKQWYFKITDYAQQLLDDLDDLDWPEKIKTMQRNWIGRSEGARLWFPIEGMAEKVEVFTTRPDTLEGATFLVLAPEHPLVPALTVAGRATDVEAYVAHAAKASELERTFADRPKTGAFTGAYAVNPLTGERVPVWIADYVLATYGTGAIMAVPAYDERDKAFADAHSLPVTEISLPDAAAAKELVAKAGGEPTITYRLRDWLVSRQRYWGVPIPIAYDESDTETLLPEVDLPGDVEFRPNGESPLALADAWKTFESDGKTWRREVDTLDTFVCSSWYYLRYVSPHDTQLAFDAEAVKKWLPVDTYVGGAEHAVLHLLYARFVAKVLRDEGLLAFDEPFTSLRNQGMILGPDHQKMSKSKGNVINPDDVIAQYGADALRCYELFMGPFDQEKPWNTTGIVGVRRFLERTWRLRDKVAGAASNEELKLVNRLVVRVSDAIDSCRFNVAIAAMMEALNGMEVLPSVSTPGYATFLGLLNPFAPYLSEELWKLSGEAGLCSLASWPTANSTYLVEEQAMYVVQVNGKVRHRMELPLSLTDSEVLDRAKVDPKVMAWLGGKEPAKEIVVRGKLVSLVV